MDRMILFYVSLLSFICFVQPQYVWDNFPQVSVDDVSTEDYYVRFLENKAPRLIDELERTLRGDPDINDLGRRMDVATSSLTGTEAEVVDGVVNSFKDVVKTIKRNKLPPATVRGIFAEILSGIKDLLPELSAAPESPEPEVPEPVLQSDGLSYFADWPHVCSLLWYPYQAEKCGEARCTACAPAMMASAQVREYVRSGLRLTL